MDIVVPHAMDPQAFRGELGCALFITPHLVCFTMRCAIGFHHQLMAHAEKVDDRGGDGSLPPELEHAHTSHRSLKPSFHPSGT